MLNLKVLEQLALPGAQCNADVTTEGLVGGDAPSRKTYRTRNQARQDVFDYIERFYNPTRRRSTLGYLRPMDFVKQAQVA